MRAEEQFVFISTWPKLSTRLTTILIQEIQKLGVKENKLALLNDYLTDRQQLINLAGTLSSTVSLIMAYHRVVSWVLHYLIFI